MSQSLRIVGIVLVVFIWVGSAVWKSYTANATNPFVLPFQEDTSTVAATRVAVPTNTPRSTRTLTLVPILLPGTTPTLESTLVSTVAPGTASTVIAAKLCADCARVRLRQTPGTAGQIVTVLDSNAPITIIGRTADSMWIQVITSDNQRGWIAARFARLSNFQEIDPNRLSALPVTAVAVEASATATSSLGIPAWLSGVNAHTRQIFQKGQSLGNHANVFSRVGDSISASDNFLTPFGTGQYDLGSYGSLSGVIGYFSQGNSFTSQSLAAGAGWSSDNLLAPGYSNPTLCAKDTPLVCEYKRSKPSIALIMIGTNDSGSGTPGQFGGNLRQIVQISLDMGVIPALSTIPPKNFGADQTARVMAFNDVIRQVAQQYDIPLWDYWSVMKNAPNQGLAPDGLHPSVPPRGGAGRLTSDALQYGYTIRNLMALQTLDTLWRLTLQ